MKFLSNDRKQLQPLVLLVPTIYCYEQIGDFRRTNPVPYLKTGYSFSCSLSIPLFLLCTRCSLFTLC